MAIREDFQSFIDRVPVGVCRMDRGLRELFINRRFAEFVGIDWQDGGFTSFDDAGLPPELRQPLLDAARRVVETGRHVETEFPLSTPRGTHLIRLRLEPETDADGRVTHVAGAGFDVTEPRRLQDALRASEERFKTFMDRTPAVAWIKDEQGRYLFANRYYEIQFGITTEEWKGKTDFDLWPEDFARRCREKELEVLQSGQPKETFGPAADRSGQDRYWHLLRFPFRDVSGQRYIGGIATDATQRYELEAKMRQESLMDDLTGLYNRRGFQKRAEKEIERARALNSPCVLFYFDMDGLKAVNDSHGHDAGDALLVAIGEVLRVTFRDSDIIGRLGGDEFAVLAVNCVTDDLLFERLMAKIHEYNRSQGLPYLLSLSVGRVTLDTQREQTLEDALARADERMYADKRGRRRGSDVAV